MTQPAPERSHLHLYGEALGRVNEARTYTIDRLGGACPTQAQGSLADGREFYFRARGGQWRLNVGRSEADLFGSEPIASGDDPTMGGMAPSDVLSILDDHLGSDA